MITLFKTTLFKPKMPIPTLTWAAALLMGASGQRAEAQVSEPFKIVVHASNPVHALKKEQVSKLFLKKVTEWDGGQTVAAVDLTENSALREHFSKSVIGKPVAAVKAYWQQQIFSGREVPPPEKPSDSQVLAYVRSNPNAIGYVSAATPLIEGVKVVQVTALPEAAGVAATSSSSRGRDSYSNSGAAPFTIMSDRPAIALPGSPQPRYPQMLRSSGIEGRVIAEFMVDTTGRAEMSTFRALTSSHSLFTSAVRDAISRTRFASAEEDGKPIRLLARQEFTFELAR
ncbi:MAG: TonB family protein [Gemmatimonadaceae bacterium]